MDTTNSKISAADLGMGWIENPFVKNPQEKISRQLEIARSIAENAVQSTDPVYQEALGRALYAASGPPQQPTYAEQQRQAWQRAGLAKLEQQQWDRLIQAKQKGVIDEQGFRDAARQHINTFSAQGIPSPFSSLSVAENDDPLVRIPRQAEQLGAFMRGENDDLSAWFTGDPEKDADIQKKLASSRDKYTKQHGPEARYKQLSDRLELKAAAEDWSDEKLSQAQLALSQEVYGWGPQRLIPAVPTPEASVNEVSKNARAEAERTGTLYVATPDEAIYLIKSGRLKPGDTFIGPDGVRREIRSSNVKPK